MSNNHKEASDEQLDQHIAALRDEPIASGPSAETIAKTLERLHPETDRRPFMERLVHMSVAQRIAAVVLFTLGGLTLYFMFMLFSATSSVAFADVVKKLTSARTLAYTSTVTQPGKPPRITRTLLAEPQRKRTEMSDDM